MTKLTLSLAIGDYDRARPLIDGRVQIDGVDLVPSVLSPEETFFRAFRHAEFDICELSFSSYTVKTSRDDCPYIAIPAYPSRAFRHTSLYVRKDRIKRPEDLKGKRIGLPEYQLTANVWGRAILADFGVMPSDVTWVRGGLEQPGRPEKIALNLPPEIKIEQAPADKSISQLLSEGDIDGILTPRMPSCNLTDPNVGWLFEDPTAAATEYYKRTGIFPIMHVVGVRKSLADAHPWLPGALFKGFQQAKALALDLLADTSATKVTLPFVEEQLVRAKELMGEDYWSYGIEPARPTLDAFLKHHHAQGLSSRLMTPEELFHPATHEAFSV
ncbi:ABC transporter substrate-binding protein [Roseibium sp.]|uniref:ABC transporter substrate-binding protein n=1 Tax=Roseibium sp. TaxID=1936156 RepID=UPI003A96A882